MNQHLVSVVIPAFNAERWLEEAVSSVLLQTYPSIEVIIVDDGSTDGTASLAGSFGDERISVIRKTNGGVSEARNVGIGSARGIYIAFLDADDAMLPENIAQKVEVLERHGVDWVFSDMWRCDAELRPQGDPELGSDSDVSRIILTASGLAVPGISSNVVVHRRCFGSGLRFDPELSNEADKDFVLGLARSFKYLRVPGALAMYRVLPGSMSRDIGLYEKDHLRLFAKARRNGLLDDLAFRRQCMANAYWEIGGSWWVNGSNKSRAIPYILRAVLMRPQLLTMRLFRSMA